MLTGIDIEELAGGGAEPPEGLEYKQGFIASHATLRGFFLLDTTTDVQTLFGAGTLADELETVQLNGNAKFWGVVYCIAAAEMTAALIDDHIDTLAAAHEISLITIFNEDCDAAFVAAVKNGHAAQVNKKIDLEFVTHYRKAYKYDLEAVEAAQNAGTLTIPLPVGHQVEVDDEILITRDDASDQLSGRFTVTAKAAESCSIADTTATFTFLAGAWLKEHPDDYCMRVDDEFELFSSSAISIVAPYTESNHVGAYVGRLSKTRVSTSAGKVKDGELINVDVDPDLVYTHHSLLDTARVVFLKRFPERVTEVHINDDNVMFSGTDTVKTMATRRTLNKAKRLIRHYGFELINDDAFDRDDGGALAAAAVAAKGLKQMKKPGGSLIPEITDYTITADWLTGGGVEFTFSITDKNRIKHVGVKVTIVPPEAV